MAPAPGVIAETNHSSRVTLLAPDDLEELLDRFKAVQRLDHSIEVERDVLVNQDVAKPWQPLEFRHELGREPGVANQIPEASV